nr:zinc finger, CCHC-type [Tanacetum cinerariifolium]
MYEAIQVPCIIDKLPPFWKDFKNTVKHLKKELTLVELGSHLRIKESLRMQDNDKPKGNNVAGPLVVNMVDHNNSSRNTNNRGKRKHHDNKANPNKKSKVTCWKCGKPGHMKKDYKGVNVGNKANGSRTKGLVDGSSNSLKGQNIFNKSLQVYYVTYVSEAYFVHDDDATWWVDSGATVHACKDRCWFKTYESLNDESILYMGNESTALMHRRGYVDLKFSSGKIVSLLNVLHVPNIRKNLVFSNVFNNNGYKQVIKSNKFVLPKHGVFIGFSYLSNHIFKLNIVNDNIDTTFMSTSKLNDLILWHARLGHVHFKRMQVMSKDGLILAFDMDTGKLGNKKYFVTFTDDALRFCYVYLLHTKDEALDKFKVFQTKVELQQGSLIKRFMTDRGDRVSNKRNRITPYELLTKRKTNLNYLKVWGCRLVVGLYDSKLKTLGERGIECIFIGYARHSKDFRFYVIVTSKSVAINSIIESKDVIFDENIFSSILRTSLKIPNRTEDIGGSVVLEKVTKEVVEQPEPELRKNKRHRTPKSFRPKFQLYLIRGTKYLIYDQHSYCFNVEDDLKTFDKAMKSQDVAF